jgi:hypothetical protein
VFCISTLYKSTGDYDVAGQILIRFGGAVYYEAVISSTYEVVCHVPEAFLIEEYSSTPVNFVGPGSLQS